MEAGEYKIRRIGTLCKVSHGFTLDGHGISVLALSRPFSLTVVLPRLQAVLRGLAEGFSKGLRSVDAGKYYQLPDRWKYTKGWLQKAKEDKSEDGTAMVPSNLHQPCRMVSHCLENVHWLENFHWLEKMVSHWLENFQTLAMGKLLLPNNTRT